MKERKKAVNQLLVFYIILLIAPVILMDRLSLDTQWLWWDFLNVGRPLLLLGALYACSMNTTTRILSLFGGLLCLWLLADFALLTYLEDTDYEDIARNSTAVIFISTSLFIFGNIFFLNGKKFTSNKYTRKGCFLVHGRPRYWAEIAASLLKMPYGRVKLVVEGREFSYQRRIFTEREHTFDRHSIYERIEPIPLERPRGFVGIKWRWWRNCYSTTRSIRRG